MIWGLEYSNWFKCKFVICNYLCVLRNCGRIKTVFYVIWPLNREYWEIWIHLALTESPCLQQWMHLCRRHCHLRAQKWEDRHQADAGLFLSYLQCKRSRRMRPLWNPFALIFGAEQTTTPSPSAFAWLSLMRSLRSEKLFSACYQMVPYFVIAVYAHDSHLHNIP